MNGSGMSCPSTTNGVEAISINLAEIRKALIECAGVADNVREKLSGEQRPDRDYNKGGDIPGVSGQIKYLMALSSVIMDTLHRIDEMI